MTVPFIQTTTPQLAHIVIPFALRVAAVQQKRQYAQQNIKLAMMNVGAVQGLLWTGTERGCIKRIGVLLFVSYGAFRYSLVEDTLLNTCLSNRKHAGFVPPILACGLGVHLAKSCSLEQQLLCIYLFM